jgi:hypothetical protein
MSVTVPFVAAPALRRDELHATADAIAEVQLPGGMIPWFPGGHADPWNHVEAAMALSAGGRLEEARAAYQWLADRQQRDGSWCTYYLAAGVEQPRRDTNVCAYVAVGVWHHFLRTGDTGFLSTMWPVVERAVSFSLRYQTPRGEVRWAVDPDGTPGRFALLAGSCSIYLSLRCAVAAAWRQGVQRPDWELAAGRLAHAIAYRPEAFEPKGRWAMDWYYPVLSGALTGSRARARLDQRWTEFVMEGHGVRCLSDGQWVTAAETAECVMALRAVGHEGRARQLFSWAQALRHGDGSYWTGWVQPQRAYFPGDERSTYSAAAMVLAADSLDGAGPGAGLFRGEGLPNRLDLEEASPPNDEARPSQMPSATLVSTRRLPQDDSSANAPDSRARHHSS